MKMGIGAAQRIRRHALSADGLVVVEADDADGALKLHPGTPAEIKRMWVSPAVRRLGLGRTPTTGYPKSFRERNLHC